MPASQHMSSRPSWRSLMLGVGFLLLEMGSLPAATATIPLPALPANARLALCGDSITEQMLYTAYVEAYLLACAGRTDVSVFQFGWGGENADQFRHRVSRGDLDAFMPTAVTIAYGANDGGGQAWQDWMQAMWTGRLTGILSALAARYPATVANTVICSPTWFQAKSDGTNAAGVAATNDTLSRFRAIDLVTARSQHLGFADFRQRILETGSAAQAKLGAGYRFGGSDGVHPGANGHLMMAHELLKALGCTGDIALITIDMTGGATASAGHVVRSATAGAVNISSTRYPFCYDYERSSAGDRLTTILPFLPFSEELNRFTLVVKNLGTASANVSWGGETHTFTSVELATGVNLAAAFTHTPFDTAFAKLMKLIASQQGKERDMIKAAGDATAPNKGWTAADVTARDALDATVHAAVVVVTHTITVVPLRGDVALAPVVSSSSAVGTVGTPFRYQIAAVNNPTSYAASNLPVGLTVNATTGLISGNPTMAIGTQDIGLSATNASGTGSGTLTLTIAAAVPLPVVTSSLTASGSSGAAFNYQIVATGSPTKYYATGLPAGLGVDSATGRISGTPTAAGRTSVVIAAENAGGSGSAMLVITVAVGP